MKVILSLLLFFSVELSEGQNAKIDRLKMQLDTARGLSQRVYIMWTLARIYGFYQTDSALQYARLAFETSKAQKYLYGEYLGYEGRVYIYIRIGDYDKSMESEVDALKIAELIPDINNRIDALARTHMMLCHCHMLVG